MLIYLQYTKLIGEFINEMVYLVTFKLKGRKSIFTVLSKSQKKNFGSGKRILGALCEKKRGLLLFIPKRMLNGDKIACSRHFLLSI